INNKFINNDFIAAFPFPFFHWNTCTKKDDLLLNIIEQAFFIFYSFKLCIMLATRSKSTRLNSSHVSISYAVFCLKKKSIRNNVDYFFYSFFLHSLIYSSYYFFTYIL